MPFFPPVTPPESGGGGGSVIGPGASSSTLGYDEVREPAGQGVRPLYPTAYWRTFNVTAAYTMGEAFNNVRADATGGAFTVTLPSAGLYRGGEVVVMKTDASGNAVTVAAASGDTLWAASGSLAAQYDFIRLIAADDGAGGYGWQQSG